jgi:hypothetical protein
MFKKLVQYYQIFCNLSLDVVIGVWLCMLPLPICFAIEMPYVWYIVLPVCTWIIYLLDHIVDVTRKKKEYPTPRHQFIKKHLPYIISGVGLLIVFVAIEALLHFNKTLFICGVILSLIVFLHLVIVNINPQKYSWLNNKELAVTLVYAGGIYIGPLSELYITIQPLFIPMSCFILFTIVVYINLIMTSLIEYRYDEQMENSSWVRVVSKKRAEKIFFVLNLFVLIAECSLIPFLETSIFLLILSYLAIAIAHVFIYLKQQSLQRVLLYRKLGELLFWIPGLVYLLVK